MRAAVAVLTCSLAIAHGWVGLTPAHRCGALQQTSAISASSSFRRRRAMKRTTGRPRMDSGENWAWGKMVKAGDAPSPAVQAFSSGKELKLGVLLLNLGGPERQEDVEPFLYNLFADPDIIRLPRLIRWMQGPIAKIISSRRCDDDPWPSFCAHFVGHRLLRSSLSPTWPSQPSCVDVTF